jgi:hypothetical protein
MLRRFQILTVLLHSAVLLWVVWSAVRSSADALHQGPWFALFWPDLPATVILVLGWAIVPDALFVGADRISAAIFANHPMSSFANFWFPILVYGSIGTWWWCMIPRIVHGLGRRLRRLRHTAAQRRSGERRS